MQAMHKAIYHVFKWAILGMAIGTSMAQAKEFKTYGEGLPLPWPFPWAKECPVNWESMQGRYLLSDSLEGEQIDLKITIVNKNGFRLIRVSRFSSKGVMIADGVTFVSRDQRAIHVWLNAAQAASQPRTSAMLQFYYASDNYQCAADQLVPILTLDRYDKFNHVQTQYRLLRLSDRAD